MKRRERLNHGLTWIYVLVLSLFSCAPQIGSRQSHVARLSSEPLTPDNSKAVSLSLRATVNSSTWQNFSFMSLGSRFSLSFDAVPGANNISALVTVSSGPSSSTSPGSVVIRFNSTGTLDATNGSNFSSDSTISYVANTAYHFEVMIDVPSQTYSVVVTPDGGIDEILAMSYAFQTAASRLDNIGTQASSGQYDLVNAELTIPIDTMGTLAPSPTPTATATPTPSPSPTPTRRPKHHN